MISLTTIQALQTSNFFFSKVNIKDGPKGQEQAVSLRADKIFIVDWGRGRSILDVSILGRRAPPGPNHLKTLTQECSQEVNAGPGLRGLHPGVWWAGRDHRTG